MGVQITFGHGDSICRRESQNIYGRDYTAPSAGATTYYKATRSHQTWLVTRKCKQKSVEAMCRLGHLIIIFGNVWRRCGDAILFITMSAVFLWTWLNQCCMYTSMCSTVLSLFRYLDSARNKHKGGRKCLQNLYTHIYIYIYTESAKKNVYTL